MERLRETIAAIPGLGLNAGRAVCARLDSLTKPRGSLGLLEELVTRYAEIRADPVAARGPVEIAVFVADHGVAEEGVSAYPSAVTGEMLRNIARGGAAISVLCRHLGYRLSVFDMGVATDTRGENLPGVNYVRIGPGTRNFAREPAMSVTEVRRAIEAGLEVARDSAKRGVAMLGIGEMGIANSTAAAAILCALSGIEPEKMAGRGTGLGDAGWRFKVAVIEAALALHRAALCDPIETLAALGGFEIAAMVGACIGGAAARIPVIVDGFIATAGAMVAERLRPGLCSYLFFSHRSAEGGHALILEALGARPILNLDLRLGEGTGAALAIATIDAGLVLLHNMATFAGAAVSEKLPDERS